MKAAFLTGHGGNEVVEIGQRPDPLRKPGEALVRLHAATVNRVDLYMRNSGAGITHTLPQILGLDGAGVVEEVDADEKVLRVGQKVLVLPAVFCGRCPYCQSGDPVLCQSIQFIGEHRDGTYAEKIALPAKNIFPMPEGLDFAEAASLGVNFLTAWRMIFTKAQMKPWETALIFGIGGGVSLAAMQIIKAFGGTAIITSRDQSKLDRAMALGADHAINGKTEDVVARVNQITGKRGVDVVIENVGEAVWPLALRSLAKNGRLVTCGATTGGAPSADIHRLFVRQLQIFGSSLGGYGEFADLLAFVAKHRIRPLIDSRFSLDQAHAALDRLETGDQFGKVVVDIA